jgi:hypothetical protein
VAESLTGGRINTGIYLSMNLENLSLGFVSNEQPDQTEIEEQLCSL